MTHTPTIRWTLYSACQSYLINSRNNCTDRYNYNTSVDLAPYYYYNYYLDENERLTRGLILLLGATVGLVNNSICLTVFSQDRYKGKLLTALMKCLYTSHMAVSIGAMIDAVILLSVDLSKSTYVGGVDLRLFHLSSKLNPARIAVLVSDGILSYLCILRFIHSINPFFVSFSRRAYTLTYLVLMTLIIYIIEVHLMAYVARTNHIDLKTVGAMSYIIAMVCIVTFNSSWIIIERTKEHLKTENESATTGGKTNESSTSSNYNSTRLSRNLFNYGMWSSGLFIIATLPATSLYLCPDAIVDKSCEFCLWMDRLEHHFIVVMLFKCYLDNLWYCVFSVNYRHDLRVAWRKITRGSMYMPHTQVTIIVPAR